MASSQPRIYLVAILGALSNFMGSHIVQHNGRLRLYIKDEWFCKPRDKLVAVQFLVIVAWVFFNLNNSKPLGTNLLEVSAWTIISLPPHPNGAAIVPLINGVTGESFLHRLACFYSCLVQLVFWSKFCKDEWLPVKRFACFKEMTHVCIGCSFYW